VIHLPDGTRDEFDHSESRTPGRKERGGRRLINSMNCTISNRILLSLVTPLVLNWIAAPPAHCETIVHENDRIVFCGDSITGVGGKGGPTGWVGLIQEGLEGAHPGGHQVLTALGASGSPVGGWVNAELKSRENHFCMDVPNVDVKATLDGGAEVLIIMLGMNDVLGPSGKATQADYDKWALHYRGLVDALKVRVHPRVIGLATITPCTEDLDSPKNRTEAELNSRLVALAKDENALVIPTHQAMTELLATGRGYRPDFHVTADFVHPNPAGHLAIAVGMLRGLGEKQAADRLLDKYSQLFQPASKDLPALSYTLTASPDSPDQSTRHFTIRYQWTPLAQSASAPISVAAEVPNGWSVEPARLSGTAGEFKVSGPLDHLTNKITLNATSGEMKKVAQIDIPAGWRIAVGKGTGLGWDKTHVTYNPSIDKLPLDQELTHDDAFARPVAFPAGGTPPWQEYVASVNFTGHQEPGSIDMAALTFFFNNDLAYGVRWIHSDKQRPVDVILGSDAFAGVFCEAISLNGESLYEGKLFAEPGHKVTKEGKLQQGWNRLQFKSTYIHWQWQFSINMAPKTGDDLSDLRYAVAPPATN